MKQFLKNALLIGLFALISVFLMNFLLSDVLFTLVHAVFGDNWYFIPYFLAVLIVTSAIMIVGWRIHVSHEQGEEKREYLKSIEGKDFSAAGMRAARRKDKNHWIALAAAFVVSLVEGFFVKSVPFIGPFQFLLFWLVENILYRKNREKWAKERMHK